MHVAPGYIVVGILVGAVAVYLYVQHDQQVTAEQMAMQIQQRCSSARFDLRYDSTLAGPGAHAQIAADKARVSRICAQAQSVRKNFQAGLQASQIGESAVGNAAGQLSGLPAMPTPPNTRSFTTSRP